MKAVPEGTAKTDGGLALLDNPAGAAMKAVPEGTAKQQPAGAALAVAQAAMKAVPEGTAKMLLALGQL